MIKKEHLVSDISKLKKVYNQSFPWLVTLAEESENAKYFKDALRRNGGGETYPSFD